MLRVVASARHDLFHGDSALNLTWKGCLSLVGRCLFPRVLSSNKELAIGLCYFTVTVTTNIDADGYIIPGRPRTS